MDTPQRYINYIYNSLAENYKTKQEAFTLASGIILGIQLAFAHAEYSMALQMECADFLDQKERDTAFLEELVKSVPIEKVEA